MDLWKLAAVLCVPLLHCVRLLPVASLKQWFRHLNCYLNALCYYIKMYIYLMDSTVLLVPNYLLAKIGIGKWGRVFLCLVFFFSFFPLDKLATLWPCADYLKSDFSEDTLQVVTRGAGTEVSGNLIASFMCLTRTEILKSKTAPHQHKNVYVKPPCNSGPCPASVFSALEPGVLLYFMNIVQIGPNM